MSLASVGVQLVNVTPAAVNNVVPFARTVAPLVTAGSVGSGTGTTTAVAAGTASSGVNPLLWVGAAFAGGFLFGETVVRPALGITYPGGLGLSDYVRVHATTNPVGVSVEPDREFEGGQCSFNYNVNYTADYYSSFFDQTFNVSDTIFNAATPGPISRLYWEPFGSGGQARLFIQDASDSVPRVIETIGDSFPGSTFNGGTASPVPSNPEDVDNCGSLPGEIGSGRRSPSVTDAPDLIPEGLPEFQLDTSEVAPRLSPVPDLIPLTPAQPGQPAPALPNMIEPQIYPQTSPPVTQPNIYNPTVQDPAEVPQQEPVPRADIRLAPIDEIEGFREQLQQAIGNSIQDLFEELVEEQLSPLPPRTGNPDCDCLPGLQQQDKKLDDICAALPTLPFDMAALACVPDPGLGDGWSQTVSPVVDLQAALQHIGTLLTDLTRYTASCPLESQQSILAGVHYEVTAYPTYAKTKFVNGGLYFIPRAGSVRFEGGSLQSEEYELHGLKGWISNPNPEEFTSVVLTPLDANYTIVLNEKLVSARFGREFNLPFG